MDTMWLRRHCAWAIALLVSWVTLAEAQNTTTRVSVATGGAQGNGASIGSDSAHGRYMVFDSGATNLVAGDTNGRDDIFVHDRQTGATERVSLGTGGVQANGSAAEISDDGRFVAFDSAATNLVAGDTKLRRTSSCATGRPGQRLA